MSGRTDLSADIFGGSPANNKRHGKEQCSAGFHPAA
jgi:hypothetical protein